MTGRPLIGLLAAIVVEAAHWTRFRWDFDEVACDRAWQFSSIAIAITAVLVWLDGSRYTALPGLLCWVPPLLLPMQFVQSYGMRDSLPMNTFSFIASYRRARNRRLGLTEESPRFNFGNVLFAVTIVASTVGSKAGSWIYLPGVVILVGWMLLSGSRTRSLALLPVLLVAGLLSVAGQLGLEKAERMIGRSAGSNSGQFNPNLAGTMIGTQGAVQQSPDIKWRLRTAPRTVPPKLLRTGSFNTFRSDDWRNLRAGQMDFRDLDSRLIGEEAYVLLKSTEPQIDPTGLPRFDLRGAVSAKTPIPLPGDAAALLDFELDGLEMNPFGTVRGYPKQAVVDGTVFWKGESDPETPPNPKEDLNVPETERETLHKIVNRLCLDRQPDLQSKLATIRAWFQRDFSYTRTLSIRHRFDGKPGGSALTQFLTESQEGHCEYFATAATLLLREAGVPARYTIGYAVLERDLKRDEWAIRGTHGHAWSRVWDESTGRWIDFDATPASWFPMVSQQANRMQAFDDAVKRVREDFFIWRNRPSNRIGVSVAMISIGLLLTAFVAKRLWRSKRRLETITRTGGYEGPATRTPLHDLEKVAGKKLGVRPPGLPFGQWFSRLRESLPDPRGLDEAVAIHQRLRFDPAPSSPAERERLAALASDLESTLRRR